MSSVLQALAAATGQLWIELCGTATASRSQGSFFYALWKLRIRLALRRHDPSAQ